MVFISILLPALQIGTPVSLNRKSCLSHRTVSRDPSQTRNRLKPIFPSIMSSSVHPFYFSRRLGHPQDQKATGERQRDELPNAPSPRCTETNPRNLGGDGATSGTFKHIMPTPMHPRSDLYPYLTWLFEQSQDRKSLFYWRFVQNLAVAFPEGFHKLRKAIAKGIRKPIIPTTSSWDEDSGSILTNAA